jgi:hypothetical protein
MVHCDTMDMGGTGQSAYDPSYENGAALGRGIGALIARSRESSFKKKVGSMLAAGDCEGAAQFALEKGRLELGTSIAQACRPQKQLASTSNQSVAGPNEIESQLRRMAANTKTPVKLDEVTTVSKVEAIGSQLLLTAVVDTKDAKISDAARSKLINDICAYKSSPPLLRAGASIRIVYFESGGRQIGAAMATREECGF